MKDKRLTIAKNIARYFHDGDYVNLGVGIPTLSANYISEGVNIILHSESGFLGQCGAIPGINARKMVQTRSDYYRTLGQYSDRKNGWKIGSKDLVDATGDFALLGNGASCFDSVTAFVIARGGRLDATVLGGLQVDEEGNLANWYVPGKLMPGMGGAMDLVCGAKKVIVAMEHVTKIGEPKILKHCTFPLTAIRCVSVIITDLCIAEFLDGVLTVVAMAPDVTRKELQSKTEATLHFADEITAMEIVEQQVL